MWLLLTVVLFLGSISTVFAQSVGDLYAKSIQVGSDYRQKHSAYQLAKNQHIQYQTAATRLAAFNATKNVLQSRNSWQVAFLTYLRSYLAQETAIANYAQTTVYLDLEKEISELNALTFNTSETTEAINQSAKDWETRLVSSDRLADAASVQITSAKLASMQKTMQTFLDENHSEDTSTLNLIRQKLQSSVDLRNTVDKNISGYKTNNWSKTAVLSQLSQSKQLLIEAANLLSQLK